MVLVHGSGPHDRDETIGPYKPFRDLAEGLAAQGIGSLRYEKRTRHYPLLIASQERFTVDDEVTDDALQAIQKLHDLGAARCVVLVGHSLGAYLSPRILKRAPSLQGAVLMAPPARSIDQSLIDQMQRIAASDSSDAQAAQKALEQALADVAEIRRLVKNPQHPPKTILGASTRYYWPDMLSYSPFNDLAGQSKPILALFGGKDFNVTAWDRNQWFNQSKVNPKLRLIDYPDLNHRFMTDSAPPGGDGASLRVSTAVINDMAMWIHQTCGASLP